MISLEFPHAGLNDSRTTNRVQMWNTWDVTKSETVDVFHWMHYGL